MKITKQQFIRYLKEKNAFASWIKNTNINMRLGEYGVFFEQKFDNNIIKFVDHYIECGEPEEIIMYSFNWSQTQEGENFWLGIHNELREISRGYKNIESCY